MFFFFFQAEDGIRDRSPSRGLGDVYKRQYNYHGDDALENPIFMKANRILAAGWGILYILIAIWSAFLLPAGHTALMQILNNTATVLMGIFTGWFEKWYPQRVAAGK